MDAIASLENEIDRLASFSTSTNDQLARALDQIFSWPEDYTAMAPAIDWYTDFLSGRDQDWLKVINVDQLNRMWKALQDPVLREKLLHTILLVDLVNDPLRPENSVLLKIFIGAEGVNESERLVGDCKVISHILIQQAIGSPETVMRETAVRNVRFFSLRILRMGLGAKAGDDRERQRRMARAVLSDIGDLGKRAPEFENTLFA
jgi:hypothetical protein